MFHSSLYCLHKHFYPIYFPCDFTQTNTVIPIKDLILASSVIKSNNMGQHKVWIKVTNSAVSHEHRSSNRPAGKRLQYYTFVYWFILNYYFKCNVLYIIIS